jgi:menaquinone-dependent protoporphyrinogen IX oxidase
MLRLEFGSASGYPADRAVDTGGETGMKTLVIFATRQGSTARSAKLIAEILRGRPGIEAEVVDARRVRRGTLESSDSFVLGSSIAMGRWKGSARRLLPRLAATGKPTAVFVSAGGMMSGRKPGESADAPAAGTVEEREAAAIAKYIDAVVPATGLKPKAVAAFGGRMSFFGKEVLDNWDGERVRAWAARLESVLK